MRLGGLVLGLIDAAIVVAVLILLGLIVVWFLSWMKIGVPENVQRIYVIIVALVGLYLLASLILGTPSVHIMGSAPSFRTEARVSSPAHAAVPTRTAGHCEARA